MADNSKNMVTREIIEKATQDMLQIVVEHLYDYEPYSDEFISDLFQLTPEEVKSISEIINDEVVSKYKLWSSQGTTNKINEAKLECQNYSNELIKDLSSIELEWCETSLPSIGETNKIYILPVTSGSNTVNTLNIWNGTTNEYVSIGNLEIDITTLYTKTEMDSILADYAKKTEVLSIDSVITDVSKATGTNVLSASTSISELDKKLTKDKVVELGEITDGARGIISTWNDSGNYFMGLDITTKDGITKRLQFNLNNNTIELFKFDGTTWERQEFLCSTKVADADWTILSLTYTDTSNTNTPTGLVRYKIKNGICYVNCGNVADGVTGVSIVKISNMPPIDGTVNVAFENSGAVVGSIWKYDSTTLWIHKSANQGGYCSFSYPVAES